MGEKVIHLPHPYQSCFYIKFEFFVLTYYFADQKSKIVIELDENAEDDEAEGIEIEGVEEEGSEGSLDDETDEDDYEDEYNDKDYKLFNDNVDKETEWFTENNESHDVPNDIKDIESGEENDLIVMHDF